MVDLNTALEAQHNANQRANKASKMLNALQIEEAELRNQGKKSAANAITDYIRYADEASLARMADILANC